MAVYLAFVHPEKPEEILDISSCVSNIRWGAIFSGGQKNSQNYLSFRRSFSSQANLALLSTQNNQQAVKFVYGPNGNTMGQPKIEAEFTLVSSDLHAMKWKQTGSERKGQF